MIGWDQLRQERYQRQQHMQLFKKTPELSPRDAIIPAWETLSQSQKEEMDLKMAVYAAQIECMDRGVGIVLDKMQQLEKMDNTLIMFLSDNGGCAEGGIYGQDFWENSAPPGGRDGYHNYGTAWANASNTPYRKYKQYTHEGGILTPFIVQWPKMINTKEQITHQPAHIIDIMATFCDIANVQYPKSYRGHPIRSTVGKSLLPIFCGEKYQVDKQLYWEHLGNVGIRQGKWKLVASREQPWELYDLSIDPTELDNVIQRRSDKANELNKEWIKWAESNGVKIADQHRKLK
jgi:arylsulfatase